MNLEDLEMPGEEFVAKCQALYEAAVEADYQTEDGSDSLYDAVENFANAALADNRMPTAFDSCPMKRWTIRNAFFSLVAPGVAANDCVRTWIREELEKRCTKHQLAIGFEFFANAANEYFRLLWIVSEHGGWRKDHTNG